MFDTGMDIREKDRKLLDIHSFVEKNFYNIVHRLIGI